ncbi:MAG: ArnT family glycosyltransferase, partial [Candidatus Aminicenantales bacterium]
MLPEPKRKLYLGLWLFLFAFLFTLRFIHLGADPPRNLDPMSVGHLSDPGGYVFNAKNKILFGSWTIDKWNLMYVTPLTHYVTYLVFLLCGVGVAQMNLVPAVFSCLILLFVFLILKRELDPWFALIGTLLLGANYQFTMFSRIAVRVMPMLFFAVLTIYLLSVARGKKHIYFIAGICCFLSFTVKGTFLLILPSILLGTFLFLFFRNPTGLRNVWRPLGLFLLGMFAVFIVWLLIFYLPHREMFQDVARDNFKWLTPHGLTQAFRNFWIRPLLYFSNMPIQTLLMGFFLLFVAYRVLRSPKKVPLLFWILGLWLCSNLIYGSVVYYKPWRHAVPLVLPISILAAAAAYRLSRWRSLEKPEKVPLAFYGFLFFWMAFQLSALIIWRTRPRTLKVMKDHSLIVLVASLAFCFAVAAVIKIWPDRLKVSVPSRIGISVAVGLSLLSTTVNLKPYLSWVLDPHYDIKTISQDLGSAFNTMRIGGLIAPLITLENTHKGHAYHTGYINKGLDFLEKYRITHLFVLNYFDEKRVYERDFPDAMKNARIIARYPLWKGYFEFLDLYPQPVPQTSRIRVYEGETFFGKGGIPRFDPSASGRFAFLTYRKGDALLELPLTAFPAGQYAVSFLVKTEDRTWADQARIKMDIVDSRRKRVLSSRLLRPDDIQHPGEYESISLPLRLKRPRDILLRFFKKGKVSIWLDACIIQER